MFRAMSDVIERLSAALDGRYTIERELGEGGMANVFLAHDERHDRPVAIKVLKPELAAAIGAERFLAEIKTTANLQHPHILPLHDSGEADSLLYFVMPYVEGESLADHDRGSLAISASIRDSFGNRPRASSSTSRACSPSSSAINASASPRYASSEFG